MESLQWMRCESWKHSLFTIAEVDKNAMQLIWRNYTLVD